MLLQFQYFLVKRVIFLISRIFECKLKLVDSFLIENNYFQYFHTLLLFLYLMFWDRVGFIQGLDDD